LGGGEDCYYEEGRDPMVEGFPGAASTAAIATLPGAAGQETGCQQKIPKYCPDGEANVKSCLACVDAHMPKLKPNCTREQAEDKCRNHPIPPAPAPPPYIPPAPPTPPVPPRPGAPQPHVVLFVVDDMVWMEENKRACEFIGFQPQ